MLEENETKLNEQKQEQPKESVDVFLEAAKEVRKETVSKAEYDKLKADNQKLTQFIVEGGDASTIKPSSEVKEPSKAELKKILADENTNNLDYVKAALKLRQTVIDEGGRDPFLPNSSQHPITSADVEGAEKVATVLQECVDASGNDPDVFNFEFERRVNDTSPLISAKVKARAKGK